jgi:heme A synthase
VNGSLVPPAEAGALVEYFHRAAAALVGLLVVASAVTALVALRSRPWLVALPFVSIGLLAVVSTVGALVVLGSVSPVVAAVDVSSALLVLALTVAAATASRRLLRDPDKTVRLAFRGPIPRFALASGIAVLAALGTGLSVGNPAPDNCFGLPLWTGSSLLSGGGNGIGIAHLVLSSAAGAFVLGLALAAWIGRRADETRFGLAIVTTVFYAAAFVSGEAAAGAGFPWHLMAIRTASTALMWAGLSLLIAREGFKTEGSVNVKATAAAENAEAGE